VLEELFAAGGERMADSVELLPVRPFYRLLWGDGTAFDYEGDRDHMLAQIAALSPDDREGYDRFLAYSQSRFAKGYEELVATPFLRFWDMLRVAPDLARLRADRSVYRAVSRFVRHPKLREALSFHALLVGGNPFETSALYALIPFLERKWGVWFPRGGTGALVDALAALFVRLGGELRLSSPVRRIAVSQVGLPADRAVHHVLTDHGVEPFDAVVSNADLHHTYASLYEGVPAAAEMRARLERMAWSMSLVVIYFGARRRWPGLAHHTVLFGPRYEALLREVFHGPRVPDDFSLYLHAPTVTDPSLAPPGCEAFYVLAPVPHLGSAPVDWQKQGDAYADRILASLESRLLPGLRESLVTRRVFTPVDFRDRLAAYQGSAFSVAPRLAQSAYFRPHNRDPEIPGLYIVGAGTHPGAGVPGVINSAKATVGLVLSDLERQGGNLAHSGSSRRTSSRSPS
jgi:phytoene desaturase